VQLCKCAVIVMQLPDRATDWSKEEMWSEIHSEFSKPAPKKSEPKDLAGRWGSLTAQAQQMELERDIAPACQRLAQSFYVASHMGLTGGLTEDNFIEAAAGLFSGTSTYAAIHADAEPDSEAAPPGEALPSHTGHNIRCECVPWWKELRMLVKYSGASANQQAVTARCASIDGQDESCDNDDPETPVRGKRPALQQRPIGINAARKACNDQDFMKEELVRSRETMNHIS